MVPLVVTPFGKLGSAQDFMLSLADHHGCRGVAPAPRFQLYVHCVVAPCHARGGCRALGSLPGASMAQGAL